MRCCQKRRGVLKANAVGTSELLRWGPPLGRRDSTWLGLDLIRTTTTPRACQQRTPVSNQKKSHSMSLGMYNPFNALQRHRLFDDFGAGGLFYPGYESQQLTPAVPKLDV